MSTEETVNLSKKVMEDVLEQYSPKVQKNRRLHMAVKDEACGNCSVKSNAKTVPGVMTARGCAYAGAKGVVWGPVKDVVHISHGPIGCGYYSWHNRRNLAEGEVGVNNFVPFLFASDFQESDIIYGGDKKLETIIHEVVELFPNAKGISILSECPVGLIGDDIENVARRLSEELKLPIIPVRCEGFRGISQSLGHHIANDAIRDHLLGKGTGREVGPYDVGIIGDYNIAGDAWCSKKILEEMGLNVVNIWTGDSTVEMLQNGHLVKLNLIHCYRSMNYIATHMEATYGTPWLEFNFFGPTNVKKSILKIAEQFDDSIMEKALKVIEKYEPESKKVIESYRPRLEGKKVMLYVGGLRPRHMIGAYEDLGMEVIGTGYEFAHNEDYEKTNAYLKDGTIIYDDVTAFELEEFVHKLKPDLIGSGIKEKYVFEKMGLPFRQMHSWDYSGPYQGFEGFSIFARDIDMAVNSPTWKAIKAPWKK
jgi:nitrogenase molybdenum-iron protein alpha chain